MLNNSHKPGCILDVPDSQSCHVRKVEWIICAAAVWVKFRSVRRRMISAAAGDCWRVICSVLKAGRECRSRIAGVRLAGEISRRVPALRVLVLDCRAPASTDCAASDVPGSALSRQSIRACTRLFPCRFGWPSGQLRCRLNVVSRMCR
jgi:hypothetical protein